MKSYNERLYQHSSYYYQEQNEVMNTLINGLGSKRTKYSAAVRQFCLRMQFHSSSAYKELRKFFSNHLPTIRTLQRWLHVIDASHGITQIALDTITEKARLYRAEGKQLHLCMVSDEMSLRKQATWNEQTRSFAGFSEEISSTKRNRKNDNNKLPVAKDALVFMVVGPNFRLTVGYLLLCGLDAIDRAVFTKEVIRSVDATGAKVISLTSDGLLANVTVARRLGANFARNKPYFPRPGKPNEKIYVIFDPPHMVKLLRKYLAEQFLRHGKDDLEWRLLAKLAEKQDSDNFSLGNKLSRNHISYTNAKMNVRLAVQTFSNSTADALEQLCEDEYEGFIGCEKTVEFLRLVNNVFDTMNCGEKKKS